MNDVFALYDPESPRIDDDMLLSGYEKSTAAIATQPLAAAKTDEIKSVWISYLEMQRLLTNKSAGEFRSNISAVFSNVKKFGLNTVIVQVRPFADALYESEYFPWSYIITGTEGKNPGFDPLEIMVSEAKKRGLRIEAWINPYRVRAAGNDNALSARNRAKIWLDAGDDSVVKYQGIISYNPASAKARQLIVSGVSEIVRNYDIDGIHIDDYFYPVTSNGGVAGADFDKKAYTSYRNAGGKLALADWRRANVEKLIKDIYNAVKTEDPDVLFGISPQSSVYNNYNAQFLDVKKILSAPGYCDYICPQIYFGFKNEKQPYEETLKEWESMIKTSSVDLYVGLAVYKTGLADNWAGNAGKTEWQKRSDIIKEMVESARDKRRYKGFVLYRYDSLFEPAQGVRSHVQKEAANLQKII